MIRSWSGNKIHGEIVDWSSFIVDEESCEKETAIEEFVDYHHTERRKEVNQKTKYLSHLSFDSHFDEANDCFCVSYPFDGIELPSGFDANARHRNWLTQIQKIRKMNQAECEKIKVSMTRKTEIQKRKILNRAKSKGKGGYLASTSATINCQVPKLEFSAAPADKENKSLKTSKEDSEYLVRETRLKHKRILKQYIQNLLRKRQMELTKAEDAREKEKENRKLLQDIVLSKGKHYVRQKIDTNISATKTGPQNTQAPQEKEETNEKKLKSIKMHKIHNQDTTLEPHTVNKDSTQHPAIATKCHNDFVAWKHKRNIPSNKKVFIISGWYPSIWQELINIGWAFNDEKESIFFDFKFTLSSSEIDFKRVSSNQVINHFKNSTCLTTKSGLISTLAKAPFLAFHNKNYLDFFPRAYDLSRYNDLVAFITDALILKGQSSLSCLLLTKNDPQPIKVNVGVLNNVTKFLQSHRNMPLSEAGDNILSTDRKIINLFHYLIIYKSEEWLFQTVDSLDFEDEFLKLLMSLFRVKQDDYFIKKWKAIKTSMLKYMNKLEELDNPMRLGINYTLDKSSTRSRQSYIDGDGSTENLWILKPPGKSRGRDIKVFFDLKALLKHILPSIKASKPNSFIVQKYIETPLTIEGHKFDIRQWVLVTSKLTYLIKIPISLCCSNDSKQY